MKPVWRSDVCQLCGPGRFASSSRSVTSTKSEKYREYTKDGVGGQGVWVTASAGFPALASTPTPPLPSTTPIRAPPGAGLSAGVGHEVADRVADQGAEFGAGDVVERVPGHEQPAEHRAE